MEVPDWFGGGVVGLGPVLEEAEGLLGPLIQRVEGKAAGKKRTFVILVRSTYFISILFFFLGRYTTLYKQLKMLTQLNEIISNLIGLYHAVSTVYVL